MNRYIRAFLFITVVFSLGLQADSWISKADMPTARTGLGYAVFNGKIYAMGGRDGNTFFDINEVYDPDSNSWTTGAPISQKECISLKLKVKICR